MSVVTWEVAKTWSQNHPERLQGSMSQNLQHAYALCAKILTQPWHLWAVIWLPYWFCFSPPQWSMWPAGVLCCSDWSLLHRPSCSKLWQADHRRWSLSRYLQRHWQSK